MKSYLILLSFIFLTAIATSFVLAVPVIENSNIGNNEERAMRTRRDLKGVFDSIANGFEGLVEGAKKVSDTVFQAFNSIFSSNTKNAITDGFEKFGKGLKGAFTGVFGENGEKVKNGMKKVGDKIKGAWNGKDSSGGKGKNTPEGEVPKEETT